MLPDDSAARKAAENDAAFKLQQKHVDQHFQTAKPSDKVIPYSDTLFQDAAVQWLIQTDQVSNKQINLQVFTNLRLVLQPIQAFEHPAFRNMIQIAGRSTPSREVKIPNRQQTRANIISLFKEQMLKLKERLNVSHSAVPTFHCDPIKINSLELFCFWQDQPDLRCLAG